jgi:hypothetical protein
MAMYEFMKNPNESLFISYSNTSGHQDSPIYRKYKSRFFTQESTSCGHRPKVVIIDDYLSFSLKNRNGLYWSLPPITDELVIFSTPTKLYDKRDFAFIKFIKANGLSLSHPTVKDYLNDIKSKDVDVSVDLEDLYYNFLTTPRVNIIMDDYFLNQNYLHRGKEMFGNNFERIRMECEGKFLKNE